MKVLYLTDPALDYLADQIYTGLCKVLGWQNIFDFPKKLRITILRRAWPTSHKIPDTTRALMTLSVGFGTIG